jgi:PAP2 superfamily
MTRHIARSFGVAAITLTLMLSPSLRPSLSAAGNNDANAGTWQMILLNSPTQVAVAAPLATSSSAYQSELADIRAAQSRITADQRAAITYWSKGGVVRWNEIMIELVARADLPPAPRPDGTYPVPDANNPFADPNFPFGNPPYAARAYSYVSVAQFDALKAAWYYKYLYNRPAPSKVDTGVQELIPNNNLPSYPSEDGVLAGVNVALLKLLFPVSASEIDAKAAEALQVATLSGKATASDVAAGYALGQSIAQVFITRAKGDGMGAAGGNPSIWQQITDAALARGDVPWVSQDIPARPPMLPLFGKVKTWMMTPDDIVRERPGPPPLAGSPLMQRDLAEVKDIVEHLTREQRATAIKWADGASTPTPPGHWNFIAESYIAGANWSEVRAARAFALLDMALHDAAVACWETKFAYSNARPAQLNPEVKTAIGLPNFPSYTSGHSTFSGAAAEVLSYLFPTARTTFETNRDEAAMSRLYGGIHYRTDNEVGLAHGKRIGGYTIVFARRDGAD